VSLAHGALAARTFPVVLSAPSGAGKTTIARRLRERRGDVVFSVSATTRPARDYEVDGRDYHFVSPEAFRRMIDGGELLEWAEVHGNHYGTPRANLDRAVERGQFLLLDIDVQGARQIRRHAPEALHVFVLPPSGAALVERLMGRGSESDATRARRLRNACAEVQEAAEFDYVVVNDDLDATVDAIEGVMAAEAHRIRRIPGFAQALDCLCDEIRDHTEPPSGASANESSTQE
jgi:guanylate kinase